MPTADRIIALVAGESGTGKSFFVAQLRQALIYDTDIGGGLAYADARIARNRSERVQAGSYPELIEDLKARHKSGHLKDVVTVAVDHVSALHQEGSLRHNPNMERDFGRGADCATREWRKLRELCRNMDCNLIVTAHTKAKWENEKAVGTTADGAKNLEGDMSIVLQIRRANSYPSTAWVQKWRRDPEDERGQIPPTFPLTITAFEALAGPGMFSPREPMALASPEQLAHLDELLAVAKIPDGLTDKWLKKAGVDAFSEMSAVNIEKCLAYLTNLLKTATNGAIEAPTTKKGKTHAV